MVNIVVDNASVHHYIYGEVADISWFNCMLMLASPIIIIDRIIALICEHAQYTSLSCNSTKINDTKFVLLMFSATLRNYTKPLYQLL